MGLDSYYAVIQLVLDRECVVCTALSSCYRNQHQLVAPEKLEWRTKENFQYRIDDTEYPIWRCPNNLDLLNGVRGHRWWSDYSGGLVMSYSVGV
jgi:hypothetical protein